MRIVSSIGRYVQSSRPNPFGFAVLAITIATTLTSGRQAAAESITGSSTGVGIASNLTLLSTINADLSVGAESGSAPGAYNTPGSASGSFSAGSYLLGNVISGSTSSVSTTVMSNITSSSVSGSASGSTTIDNLSLSILGSGILSTALVTVGATTLTSSASVSGSYGSLLGSGTPTVSGLDVKVLGLDITSYLTAGGYVEVSALASEPGLSALSTLTGLEIGLDVTSQTGNGISSLSDTSENISLSFANVVTSGLTLNGTVDIGKTNAVMGASVPEPASLMMVGVGLAFAGAFGVRRSRSNRAVLRA